MKNNPFGVEVGDTVSWCGNYFDGYDETGNFKNKFKSGENIVSKIEPLYPDDKMSEYGIRLDNNKYFGLKDDGWKIIKKHIVEETVEISKETLRGLYLILSGISDNHTGEEVYEKALPIMSKAHKEIIKLGNELGFDCRGGDL